MSGTVFFGSPNALLIYNRDPATGKLTQRAGKAGCISQDGTGGQCDVNRLVGGFGGAMAISPDGKQLYALGGGGVVVFDILAGNKNCFWHIFRCKSKLIYSICKPVVNPFCGLNSTEFI